jgi:hypothetical protein|tara:strand:- start:28 stop:396 length:369 start_codon:yes stop_codon:yes gene_type:complete
MSEEYFKIIQEPNSVRKTVLESSKEIIQNLKSYQTILDIRKRKAELLKNLKVQIKEINLLLDNIRDLFPSELIAKYGLKEKKTTAKKGAKTKKEKKKSIEPSELTKLENKLTDIESKLQTLS